VWAGVAQDSISHETFDVDPPTITDADYQRLKSASAESRVGWDLSGTGNAHEENRKPQEKPVTREQAAAEVPAPGMAKTVSDQSRDGSVELITNIQAKHLSELLLANLGTREKAQAWLKTHADVERSALVRQNQYEALKDMLTKMKKKEN